MKLYQRRLHSNLMYDLRALTPDASAVATKLAALIDGVYLRAALNVTGDRKEAAQQVSEALESFLNAKD